MRAARTRKADASFELNLAPFLDIIVCVVPMLLLSVAFIQIKMIETNIPQVVAKKIEQDRKNKDVPVTVEMHVGKKSGFKITLNERGARRNIAVATKSGALDFVSVQASLADIKRKYTDVFRLDLAPESDVSYDDIVKTMDIVRKLPNSEKVAFTDTTSGQKIETDLMFPDVTFSNILGD